MRAKFASRERETREAVGQRCSMHSGKVEWGFPAPPRVRCCKEGKRDRRVVWEAPASSSVGFMTRTREVI